MDFVERYYMTAEFLAGICAILRTEIFAIQKIDNIAIFACEQNSTTKIAIRGDFRGLPNFAYTQISRL